MAKKILIVEDDAHIRELLHLYLEREGYKIIEAENGQIGVEQWREQDPDMILLDVMMPVMDGWQVCKIIRQESKVPIIIMTAKGETFDKVNGLEMGADDYIVKPLEMREVVARVRAIFRRFSPEEKQKISYDKLTIDKEAYDLIIDGKRVDAPPKEIELLYFMAQSPNRVFTRAQLLDKVWGFEYEGDTRTVDVHIKRLREKLDGVSDKWAISTKWGVGYKFETFDQKDG
ncbi:MAG: response regulator transcription factor [Butyricicoccus sp.]